METEDPETLRCYPGTSRPDDWMTIPKLAAQHAREILNDRSVPTDRSEHEKQAMILRRTLDEQVLGGTSPANVTSESPQVSGDHIVTQFSPESGIHLMLTEYPPSSEAVDPPTVIYLRLNNEDIAHAKTTAQALQLPADSRFVLVDLRATGQRAWHRDRVGRAVDHNSAEWSLWLGRPLLGQWVCDIRSAVSVMQKSEPKDQTFVLVGEGPAGVAAVCAGAIDSRIHHVMTLKSMAGYVTDRPYENQRLGTIPHAILRDVGDIPHIAAMISPRKLTVASPVDPQGKLLSVSASRQQFADTHAAYDLSQCADRFSIAFDSAP